MSFLSLLAPSTTAELESKSVTFGEPIRHKTLILDLDETLIHSRPLINGKNEFVESEFTFLIEIGE
jgi:TFIIF-interacting CTD phosphatase-like protein